MYSQVQHYSVFSGDEEMSRWLFHKRVRWEDLNVLFWIIFDFLRVRKMFARVSY